MSRVVKRSVAIRGHRTSFSLEQAFFDDLGAIAREQGVALAALIAEIDDARARDANLSSAIRLFVLDWAKSSVGGSSRAQDREEMPRSGFAEEGR